MTGPGTWTLRDRFTAAKNAKTDKWDILALSILMLGVGIIIGGATSERRQNHG